MGSTYNGRLYSVIVDQKQPVAMLWDYENFDFDGWVVPANLPKDRLDRVLNFLQLRDRHPAARRSGQKYISYGPARASLAAARRGVDGALHADQPRKHEELSDQQYQWWADNQDEVEAKFQAWQLSQ